MWAYLFLAKNLTFRGNATTCLKCGGKYYTFGGEINTRSGGEKKL